MPSSTLIGAAWQSSDLEKKPRKKAHFEHFEAAAELPWVT